RRMTRTSQGVTGGSVVIGRLPAGRCRGRRVQSTAHRGIRCLFSRDGKSLTTSAAVLFRRLWSFCCCFAGCDCRQPGSGPWRFLGQSLFPSFSALCSTCSRNQKIRRQGSTYPKCGTRLAGILPRDYSRLLACLTKPSSALTRFFG